MTGLIKHILSIKSIVLLITLFQAATVMAQAPQAFDTDEDTGFYYTIQKGDTLWDLSQKFYNSQWDWPGLWEMNKDIKNPHWIYPGNKIRVYLKPEFQNGNQGPALTKAGTVSPRIIPKFNYPIIDRTGFIRETEETVLGTVIRQEDGNLMMSKNDIIYITPTEKGSLVPGERYHIFSTESVKEKLNGTVFKGIKHLIKAKMEVIETNDRYVKAVITKGYRDATVGDKIMSYFQRETMLPIQENPAPIDGAIICSEDNDVMVNDFRVAFINKGKADNIRPGQIYSILQVQKNKSVHDGEDSSILDPIHSGKLIVLHTEDISSTVMVLSSKRDIHPGDLVN